MGVNVRTPAGTALPDRGGNGPGVRSIQQPSPTWSRFDGCTSSTRRSSSTTTTAPSASTCKHWASDSSRILHRSPTTGGRSGGWSCGRLALRPVYSSLTATAIANGLPAVHHEPVRFRGHQWPRCADRAAPRGCDQPAAGGVTFGHRERSGRKLVLWMAHGTTDHSHRRR